MSNGVGIDISGFQPDDVPGDWEFIVVKSTEGNTVVNPKLSIQWQHAARTTRGLYHYARPGLSAAQTQATVFCNDALARGFKPGVDLWQLDAEDGENAGVSALSWQQFVDSFMSIATARLGARGFLYAGWYFVQAHGLLGAINKWNWWLPAYGSNDGGIHPYPADVPPGLVVIHQYTSHGNLDQNVVRNQARYNPTPTPPTPKVKPMYSPALGPIAAVWRDPHTGLVRAAVAPNGDVYVWDPTVQYRPWPNKAVDFAGREAAAIGPPIIAGGQYTITATSGEKYTP